MADNAQKLHFSYASNKAAEAEALALIHNLGKGLPVTIKAINANQTAMTVSFDTNGSTYTMPTVTVPMQLSRYYRIPYAVGDKGYVLPGSTTITPASGLGPTVADFTTLSNLSTLAFHPVANVPNFPAMDDPSAVQHNAPNGTISRDDQKISQVKTHPTNGATLFSGGANAPQQFTALPNGNTTHTASQDHTATVGETKASTAKVHTHTSILSHSISAPMIGIAASTALSFSAPSISFPAESITAPDLAPGAAATNVGTLGGDLDGTLPDPKVISIVNVTQGNMIPTYANNAAALAGGLVAGQLYANTSINATEHVLCVVH